MKANLRANPAGWRDVSVGLVKQTHGCVFEGASREDWHVGLQGKGKDPP